jgi:hypothetical protein
MRICPPGGEAYPLADLMRTVGTAARRDPRPGAGDTPAPTGRAL